MNPRNKSKTCPGCIQNTQRIAVLENRVAYLEQHMVTKTSSPVRKGRSRSRKSRTRKDAQKPVKTPPTSEDDIFFNR